MRVQPAFNDDTADGPSAAQTIATNVNTYPQLCYPPDESQGWPFCSYWVNTTACASYPWSEAANLTCSIIPIPDDGGDGRRR